MQQDLFSHFEQQQSDDHHLPMQDAGIRYYPDFLDADQALDYFNVLNSSLQWRQEQICLYGKIFDVPRLQAWYGDAEANYRYSNLTMQALPWTTELLALRQRCEQLSGAKFNSVLANLYRDNQDSMGMHADDEPALGKQPTIASVSLGERRTLIFVHKITKQRIKLPLAAGSLLIMAGDTQQFWQHGIAKQRVIMSPRINLTFRFIHQSR